MCTIFFRWKKFTDVCAVNCFPKTYSECYHSGDSNALYTQSACPDGSENALVTRTLGRTGDNPLAMNLADQMIPVYGEDSQHFVGKVLATCACWMDFFFITDLCGQLLQGVDNNVVSAERKKIGILRTWCIKNCVGPNCCLFR